MEMGTNWLKKYSMAQIQTLHQYIRYFMSTQLDETSAAASELFFVSSEKLRDSLFMNLWY